MSRLRSHYAILIFIGCCSLTAGGFALVYNLAGIYMYPVSQSLGLTTADFSLWLAADGTIAIVSMPLAGHLLRKENMHHYMTMGALVTIAGVLGFRFCTQPFHFILCGLLTGFGMPYLYGIAEVTLIGNWFAVKKQGRFLGIAMACQGLAAAIWAPLFTQIIQVFGYQNAYHINAAMIALLTLPWTFFVFRRDPRQLGMLPFGLVSGESDEEAEEADAYIGVPIKEALKKAGLWIVLIAACTVCIGMGLENHQQVMAVELLTPAGFDVRHATAIGGFMMTCFGIGTVIGDVGFGFLIDKLPMRGVFMGYLSMLLAGLALWCAFGTFAPSLMLGSFLLGTHNGLASVGYPLLIRRMFGGLHYSKIYAVVNTVCSLFGGYTTVLVSLAYEQLGGSYANVCMAAIAVIVVLMVFSNVAISCVGKYRWQDDKGAEVEPFKMS